VVGLRVAAEVMYCMVLLVLLVEGVLNDKNGIVVWWAWITDLEV